MLFQRWVSCGPGYEQHPSLFGAGFSALRVSDVVSWVEGLEVAVVIRLNLFM